MSSELEALSSDLELAGVAVGLISLDRFRDAVSRFGPRLLDRVFTKEELAYALRKRDPAPSLAARFAAKCAGLRALARAGMPRARLRDLEVVRRRTGEPTLSLRGGVQTAGATGETGETHFRLSLTHDPGFAAAAVFLERRRRP